MNQIPMRLTQLLDELLPQVQEVMPWDVEELQQKYPNLLLVDIREPYEFDAMRIARSINVPRGILELACEWDYEETVPKLVEAHDHPVLLLCRSGNRTVFAAHTLQRMGYRSVYSLATGLKGWNDYELPLVDSSGDRVGIDSADDYFEPRVRREQLHPSRRTSN